MKYLSVKQMAERWKLTDRSVRRYCDMGMIDGAFPVDGIWIIPEDAKKPVIDDNPPDPVGPAKQVIAQRGRTTSPAPGEWVPASLSQLGKQPFQEGSGSVFPAQREAVT